MLEIVEVQKRKISMHLCITDNNKKPNFNNKVSQI